MTLDTTPLKPMSDHASISFLDTMKEQFCQRKESFLTLYNDDPGKPQTRLRKRLIPIE
jgi:hypothetical protein